MVEKKENKNVFGIGMLVGMAAGALAGIFLAPKSGKENRDAVAMKLDHLRKTLNEGNLDEKVQAMFGEVTTKGKEIYIQATDQLADKLSNVQGALSEIDKDKYLLIVGQVLSTIKDEHKIPAGEITKIKAFLESDYQHIVGKVQKKVDPKKTAPKKKPVKKLPSKKLLAKK